MICPEPKEPAWRHEPKTLTYRYSQVIYYYYNQSMPLFALDIYAKNEKPNLSEADKRSLKRLLPILVSRYMKRS